MTNLKTTFFVLLFGVISLTACVLSYAQESGQYNMVIDRALDSIEKAREEIGYKIIPSLEEDASEIDYHKDVLDEAKLDVLEADNSDIIQILKMISDKTKIPIIAENNVKGNVTIYLQDVLVRDALRIILSANNLAYREEGGKVIVMTAKDFEDKYGYSFSHNIITKAVPLKGNNYEPILKSLENMKSEDGQVVYDKKAASFILVDSASKINEMVKLINELDIELITKEFTVRYGKFNEIVAKAKAALTKSVGSVHADEANKLIRVTDVPEKVKEIGNLIEQLDHKEEQITIKVKIMQIILDEEYITGVDWDAIVSDYQGVKFNGFVEEPVYDEEIGKLGLGTISKEDFVVLLEALDTVGNLRDVREEIIKIKPGEKVDIDITSKELDYDNDQRSNGYIYEENKRIKYSFIANVDKDVKITFKPELDITKEGQTIKEYTVDDKAQIDIAPDSTLIIGGLFKKVMTERTNKVPLLGNIPLLGFAFRSHGRMLQKTEVVVFLTPVKDKNP